MVVEPVACADCGEVVGEADIFFTDAGAVCVGCYQRTEAARAVVAPWEGLFRTLAPVSLLAAYTAGLLLMWQLAGAPAGPFGIAAWIGLTLGGGSVGFALMFAAARLTRDGLRNPLGVDQHPVVRIGGTVMSGLASAVSLACGVLLWGTSVIPLL